MSQISGPTPTPSKPRQRTARNWSPGRDDLDPRSLIFGILLAAIIWPLLILILWFATRHVGNETIDPSLKAARPKPVFNIEISPDEFIMPRRLPQKPPQFVEANPDAPENTPDNTNNFGARNTQASQEKPNPDAKGDRAATEGKKDWQSNQVVSGRLTPPTEAPPPEPPPTQQVAAALEKAAEARKEENPLPGFEKLEGTNPNGFGMNKAERTDNVTQSQEKVEGAREAPLTVGQLSPTQPQIDPRKPQPRMRIEQQRVRPAIFAENRVGTSNIGPASIDSRWSNYGAYLQRLIDAVQVQFDRLNEESRIMPPTGTVVTVKFILDKEGAISEILDSSSTGGKQAENICKSAITSRAPYGKWTDDMVALLGEQQEMTFNFYWGTP